MTLTTDTPTNARWGPGCFVSVTTSLATVPANNRWLVWVRQAGEVLCYGGELSDGSVTRIIQLGKWQGVFSSVGGTPRAGAADGSAITVDYELEDGAGILRDSLTRTDLKWDATSGLWRLGGVSGNDLTVIRNAVVRTYTNP